MSKHQYDREEKIIEAGIDQLREHGFAKFTQPNVARRIGVRQSHITYYFPTRSDLVKAVVRTAVDRQLAAIDSILEASSPRAATALIAKITIHHENTRVVMALAQAADAEPALHGLLRELADGTIARIAKLLKGAKIKATDEHTYLIHSLLIGMSVINLSVAQKGSEQRSARTLDRLFKLLKPTS